MKPPIETPFDREQRAKSEHLMGDRSNFPLFRKWFPDVPFNDRYMVMAIHIEEALRKIDPDYKT